MSALSASQRRTTRRTPAPAVPRGHPGTQRRGGIARSARVRWDRIGRLAMLCVMGALLYLYLSAGLRMFSTWRESQHHSGAVTAMRREHALLVRQHETLSTQATLEGEARQLGMMKKGEQPYLVGGLPAN
jgi:hypothetical protein